MKIKSLHLENFRGFKDADFYFGDFSCLYGRNGEGKTTVLDAVSLLCGSLDFVGDLSTNTEDLAEDEWKPTATAAQRTKAYLAKNARFWWEPTSSKTFYIEGIFEHEGKEFCVRLGESGFIRNEITAQPWWWAGLAFFAKFDSDMVNFQLRHDLWPKFSEAYEAITGIKVDPEIMIDTDLEELGQESRIVTGFWLYKDGGRVHSRQASAGERKIAKTLTQVVNLEPTRLPGIVLVDNIEMHVHYKRHLRMIEEVKKLFAGMQLISTTHSVMVIEGYHPQEHLINVEEAKKNG